MSTRVCLKAQDRAAAIFAGPQMPGRDGYPVDDFSEYLGLALVVFAVGALAAAYVSGL
jgi:hypothetical protein